MKAKLMLVAVAAMFGTSAGAVIAAPVAALDGTVMRVERPEKPEQPEKPEKVEKLGAVQPGVEALARVERPEKPEKPEKPETTEKLG